MKWVCYLQFSADKLLYSDWINLFWIFLKKNCCCNTFILFLKFFMRFQFRLKSCRLVFEIFKEKTTEQVNKIRLNMHFYFASFHIKLKLIATEYKMLLKCSVLIKCIILLYFLLVFWFYFQINLIRTCFCIFLLFLLYWMIIKKLFFSYSWFKKLFSSSNSLWTAINKLHITQFQQSNLNVLKFKTDYWFF